MKKLIITIFAVFIFNPSFAEEPINFLCDAMFMYTYEDGEFEAISGNKSFTIYPQSKIYIIGNEEGTYKERNNIITWRTWLIDSKPFVGDEYALNRLSGEFTDSFGIMKDDTFIPSFTAKYQCKKIEPLF